MLIYVSGTGSFPDFPTTMRVGKKLYITSFLIVSYTHKRELNHVPSLRHRLGQVQAGDAPIRR